MEFVEQVRAFASTIQSRLESAKNEQATDHYLIMPFISEVLGYNPFNPDEVVPQYDANVGPATNYKLDYAVLQDNKPVILIECKCYGTDFSKGREWNQLDHYFNAVDNARIGILTDGVIYEFYADLEKPNKMDKTPFLRLDLLNLNEASVKELAKLTKASFDAERVIDTASELKYVGGIKSLLRKQFQTPSEEFTKFFFRELCPGNKFSGQFKDVFWGYTQRALEEFLQEEVDVILDKAKDRNKGKVDPPETATEGNLSSNPTVPNNIPRTEFTEDEQEGFYILKSILRQTIDPSRITHKDTQSYCNVLLDDNAWRQIVRLHFNNSDNKKIEIYSMSEEGNKTSEFVPIENLNDIYKYADRFKSIVIAYEAKAASS